MKKRIVVISSIALAVVIIITSSIIIFRSGVVSYVWNESAAVLTGVDRNEKVIVGGDRKVTVFNFADKAEMTISNRIEGKEDKEIEEKIEVADKKLLDALTGILESSEQSPEAGDKDAAGKNSKKDGAEKSSNKDGAKKTGRKTAAK